MLWRFPGWLLWGFINWFLGLPTPFRRKKRINELVGTYGDQTGKLGD